MHDAGDLVACADVEQRRQIGDVGLLHRDLRAGEAGRRRGGPALDQHTALAQVEQRLHRVGADKTQASGDQDHRIAFCRRADYQYY